MKVFVSWCDGLFSSLLAVIHDGVHVVHGYSFASGRRTCTLRMFPVLTTLVIVSTHTHGPSFMRLATPAPAMVTSSHRHHSCAITVNHGAVLSTPHIDRAVVHSATIWPIHRGTHTHMHTHRIGRETARVREERDMRCGVERVCHVNTATFATFSLSCHMARHNTALCCMPECGTSSIESQSSERSRVCWEEGQFSRESSMVSTTVPE
jgi:hypothetical protein